MNVPLATEAPRDAVTWQDYLALTKPRIISLLLFTALTAMFIAPPDALHHVTLGLFLAVALGGYMAAGSANTLNMVYDRDIDERMKRTAARPTVTRAISARSALLFALALAVGACLLLGLVANPLTAVLAMAGLAYYVLVYTMLLKRRTWHNIVIGGAAGAFPPLVGWAAVTGSLTPFAWLLFAIIFVWTPVHFWALAILMKDEYSAAGVPMLPSIRGERATVIQIAFYTLVTVAVTLLPMMRHQAGALYGVSAVLLNVALVAYSVQLFRQPERRQASRLFHYSMIYLAMLFLMLAFDRGMRL